MQRESEEHGEHGVCMNFKEELGLRTGTGQQRTVVNQKACYAEKDCLEYQWTERVLALRELCLFWVSSVWFLFEFLTYENFR